MARSPTVNRRRSHGILLTCVAAALICLDQLSKLLVKAFARADSLNSIIYFHSDRGWFLFHLHPELHDRYPLVADIIIAAFSAVIIVSLAVYLRRERAALLRDIPGSECVKSCPKISETAFVLCAAGLFCSTVMDAFVWGGSLDFLCVEWAKFYTDGEPYTLSYRVDVDPKDVFLGVGAALLLLRMFIFKISQRSLPKPSRKLISRRSSHILRSIREAAEESAKSAPRQELNFLDVLFISVCGMILAFGFGYIIYIFSLWVVIPVAAELIPALGDYLERLGSEHDPEIIYGFIQNFCILIGLFPGMYASNADVKRRKRSFTHDTGGMIVTLDGLKYHLRRYLILDYASVFLTVLAGYLLYIFNFKSVSPFTALYELFGEPKGVLLSILAASCAQLFGVICAQKSWRASCFYGG